MVHDDGDVEGHVRQDSRLPKAGLAQPQATPDSLSHRLVSKISAIPAYLKTAEDADSLRLASPEGSNASLTGWVCILTAAGLQKQSAVCMVNKSHLLVLGSKMQSVWPKVVSVSAGCS